MNSCRMVLALPVLGAGYHDEQASAASEVARRLNVQLEILSAKEDSITQSQQLLERLQSNNRPDAILLEPAGTCLPIVAQMAQKHGVGWAVINRHADYLESMAMQSKAPVFSLSTDHKEVGRIQGRQMAALLPQGGMVLYVTGSASQDAAQQRTEGMMSSKPANIEAKIVRGNWTEEGARHAFLSMFALQTARRMDVKAIICQNDLMAAGVRKVLPEIFRDNELDHWLSLPCTGCDGLQQIGMRMAREHRLSATVVIPPNAGRAVEMMEAALRRGAKAPLHSFTEPHSYPELERLAR